MDLQQLLQGADDAAKVAELKKGRTSAEPEIETYLSQLDPTKHDVCDPLKRKNKRVKVDPADPEAITDEEGVKQVTTTTDETGGKFRTEQVARIALALQKLIVKRAVAFTFGNPVQHNAEPEEGSETDVLKAIKKVLYHTKARTINRTVAKSIFSSTEAAEYWYTTPSDNKLYGFNSKYKLKVAVFSPLKGDKLYPYFDETGDMVAFSREYTVKDSAGVETTYFETYTAKKLYKWVAKGNSYTVVEGYPKDNEIGKIPVIYGSQPAVEWEDVQGLIDRLEKLLSNFADTNDYHASPKIVTKGEILGWAKKGDAGAVIEMDSEGSADYLTWSQAPEAVKLEIETLLRMIYTITQTPDISFDAVKGLGAISGVALKLLFMDAHLKVQDKMEIFDDYLQRRLSVIQAFLRRMNVKEAQFAAACESLTVEPEIVPFMIEDEKAKLDLVLSANGQKAVVSRKTAVQLAGFVKDVDKEVAQIEEEESAASFGDAMQPYV